MMAEAIAPPAPMAPFSGGANIPRALRREKRWVPWITQWLPKARGGAGKWDKRPGLGKSTAKPDTWLTFADALAECKAHPDLYAGIGYCTTEQTLFVGIDLDRCITDGVIASWAQEVVDQLISYTEISPSGTGLRIMVAGHVPNDWNNHDVGIEVYGGNTARFLTITGTHLSGTPLEVCEPPAGSLEGLEQRYAKERRKADVIDLNMPELLDDLLLPAVATLDLPHQVKDFLSEGLHSGDRSRAVFGAAVALYAAGLADDEVFTLLATNDHIMEIALDHRRQDHDRALLYVWREHCCKGKARAIELRALSADEFDVIEAQGAPLTPNLPSLKPTRFQFQQAAAFAQRKPACWLVKGVLPQAGLCVVYGASGSGKTFFTLDMVASIARGVEWRGKKVAQGRAAYICAEGAGGFQNRLAAYAEHQSIDLANLSIEVLDAAPDFMQTQDIKDLISALQTLGSLKVIVVDTTARVMPGANENSGEDMGRVVKHCDIISRVTGALVILVHHAGKDATKGARGWSGLRAAADVEIEVVRAGDDRAATVSKMKDGEDGAEFGFRLTTVPVAEDEDGEAVTSCVLEHTRAVAKAERKREPTGANQQVVLRALQVRYDLTGEGVYPNELLEAAVNELIHDPSKKRDTRRQRCLAALNELQAANRITQNQGRLEPA